MQIGAAAAALGVDAFGEHAHHGVEILALEIAVRIRAAHEIEQLVLAVFARRDFGDDLLREHVERMLGDAQAVELAAAHGIEQRDAVDELVAAAREDAALRHAAHRVVGAAHALQEYRDAARRAELAHQLHVADVDAELERGGGHHDLERAGLEALLGVEAGFLGEAAVVGRDVFFAEALGQMARDALDHAARVREHQRGVVLFDELRELVVDRGPHFARHHRFERRRRHHQVDVAFADVAGVDDAGSCPVAVAGPGVRDRARRQLLRRGAAPFASKSGLSPFPTRNLATSSMGFCVADRPMRWMGCAALAARRASVSARCAPRLVCATAWISSTMTVRTVGEHLAARGAGQQ